MNYFAPFAMLARKLHLARQKEGQSELCELSFCCARVQKLIVNCETVKGLASMRPRRYSHEPHGKSADVLIVTLVQIL